MSGHGLPDFVTAIYALLKALLFEAEAEAIPDGTLYLDFFQLTKEGNRKGIVALNLEDLPEEVTND